MRKFSQEDKAGLYLTVIVHLAVVIVLLIAGLGYSVKKENSFVLDFTKYEDLERMQAEAQKLQKEAELKESISRKLQEELGGGQSEVKSVAVNRAALQDDRGTNAEQLYKDAERLAKELQNGYEIPDEEQVALPSADKNDKKKTSDYKGPSVISYDLGGRKASHLPIPAYRCNGGGEVKVIISVTPAGKVIAAKVEESESSDDACLRSFAIRAAKRSRFSAKPDAPAKQTGYIIYSFIAQ